MRLHCRSRLARRAARWTRWGPIRWTCCWSLEGRQPGCLPGRSRGRRSPRCVAPPSGARRTRCRRARWKAGRMRARALSRRLLLVGNAEPVGEAFEGRFGHRKIQPELMPELQGEGEVLLAERAHVCKRLVPGLVVLDACD